MLERTLPRILIVDDEAAHMRALCDTLGEHGYQPLGFANGASALAALRKGSFELLLTDLMMPGIDGISLLRQARQIDPDLVGIIMTGEGTIASAVDAMKSGALDYILKPFKLSTVLPVLARALDMRRLRIENAELERRLRERTLELEASNRDLEAFSYSISHDLRSPLTAVTCMSELLLEKHGAELPEQGQQLVHITLKSANRMSEIIDDMLRLAHLGTEPLEKTWIDVGALIGELVDELRTNETRRTVEVRVRDLVEAYGDSGLVRQVFANLLSNAFKFTRGREAALIEVSCRSDEDQIVYTVRDNGAGFDSERAKDLFSAFKRFHSTDQFEGTGIGLSICQRIVARHGGRIWAESRPHEGATFHVGLPEGPATRSGPQPAPSDGGKIVAT